MQNVQAIVLKRSLTIWVLIMVMAAVGLYEWHALLIGVPVHSFPGRKARDAALAAPFLAVLAAGYDLFMRFIRNDRLEFSELGIGDYASSDRLGDIRWGAVDGVAFKRQWLGGTFIIHFKEGVALNDTVERWDRLIIGSRAISDADLARITMLLTEQNISGGLDKS